jgi:Flp pilus assembly protein TadG
MTTTQVAVLMPALLFWIMLIVQFGLWYHAKEIADAAAAEAVDAAQTSAGTSQDGEAAALAVLDQAGNLENAKVTVTRGVDRVVAVVTGSSPQLVPGFSWSVTGRSDAPVERFIPEHER